PRAAPKHTVLFVPPTALGPLPDVARHVETSVRAGSVRIRPDGRCFAAPSLRRITPRRVELIAPRIFPLHSLHGFPRRRGFPFFLRGQPESSSPPPSEKTRLVPAHIDHRLIVGIRIFVPQLPVTGNHTFVLP